MAEPLRVALLYGGRSVEHMVSCRSGAKVGSELLRAGHHVIPIAISRDGRWSIKPIPPHTSPKMLDATFDPTHEVTVAPGAGLLTHRGRLQVDTCFPVTHGTGGEDGLLQGLLELAGLPCVGSGPAASTFGMHKHIAKLVATRAGVPTLPSICLSRMERERLSSPSKNDLLSSIIGTLGRDIMVKPEDGGSSVGVTPVRKVELESLGQALDATLRYTEKALLEPLLTTFIELECAILDVGGTLQASYPGMVVAPKHASHTFLTYEQKYTAPDCAYIQISPPLEHKILERIRRMAATVAKATGIEGYARVDFMLDCATGSIWFNEINTLPGMTGTSHFPTLATAMGYPWPLLLDTLLKESIERHGNRNRIDFHDPE